MDWRFGIHLRSVDGWADRCRRAEELGYDVLTVPDHLGALSPWSALAAAAMVTSRIRLGTLVLNAPFHNPALLARDISTVDQLSGGRVEVGLGSGHMKREFYDAGIEWRRASGRVQQLHDVIHELVDRFANSHEPAPIQTPMPPLLVAGNSPGVLDLAADHADIVGFAGLRQAPGEAPGAFVLDSWERLGETVAAFAELDNPEVAGRSLERNFLIQAVTITDDAEAVAQQWLDEAPGLGSSPAEFLAHPQLLIGTRNEIIQKVHALRETFGFTYLTVMEPALDSFADLMTELRSS